MLEIKSQLGKLNSLTLSLAFLAIIGIFGLVAESSYTSYFFGMVQLLILAYSLNIITGLTGYANFGHVVFYGLGTYAVATFITFLHPLGFIPHTFLLVIAAGGVAALFALLVGTPVLRLRGDYFAIATLGIVFATQITIKNIKWLGEGRGLYFIGKVPMYEIKTLYAYLIIIAFAAVITSALIFRVRLGYGLRAIRDDEDVAEVMGVNTAKYKVMAFAIAAFFAGMAGGVMALFFSASYPEYFAMGRSVEMFAAIILGGAGTLLGPLIGATVFWVIKDALLINLPYYHLVFFGIILVVLVLFFPKGILGLINRLLAKKGKVLQ
jgi:branched-chain amino acid transport system permease protein